VDNYPNAAREWLRQVAALNGSDRRRYGELRRGAIAAARRDLWVSFVNEVQAREVAEIGVYRGSFAARLLRDCPGISSYYMVDPWRYLDNWNKPANKDDDAFEQLFRRTMRRTRNYADKRVVLRGTTTEVIDQLPDEGLDFVYLDGDHTLRGITIDLVTLYPKVKAGGWIGGDDFSASVWQHTQVYEPTFVFPFAVYFAEAVGARIYGLPYNQFLLEKSDEGFAFVDLTGRYARLDLRRQLERGRGRTLVAHLRRKLRIRTRLRSLGRRSGGA
jgi:hypothetical protein